VTFAEAEPGGGVASAAAEKKQASERSVEPWTVVFMSGDSS
jgi:hypothetical protein